MKRMKKTAAIVAAMSLMMIGAGVTTQAREYGWEQKGPDWYFYVNGSPVTNQWALDSARKWYFLGEDGKMVTNSFINNDYHEAVDETDDSGDVFYYVGADGAMVTDWKQIDLASYDSPTSEANRNWYYFGSSGEMYQESWVWSGVSWYYMDEEGKMLTNTFVDDRYYMNDEGRMITGWYKLTEKDEKYGADSTGMGIGVKNNWVYANPDGDMTRSKNTWRFIDGTWYLFGTNVYDGTPVTNATATTSYAVNEDTVVTIGAEKFLIRNGGYLTTGKWTRVDADGDGRKEWYYSNSNGVLAGSVKSEVKLIDRKYYFFDAGAIYDEDSTYAYSYKDNATKETVYVKCAATVKDLAVAKSIVDADANIAGGNEATVTIYKLQTGTKTNYTAQ